MKQQGFFYRLGEHIYSQHKWIILLWLLGLAILLPTLSKLMHPFDSSGFENTQAESYTAMQELDDTIGYQKHRVLLLFSKKHKTLSDEQFQLDVNKAIKNLSKISDKHELMMGPIKKGTILVVLAFKNSSNLKDGRLSSIESEVNPSKNIRVYFGGSDIFLKSINKQTQKDLFHADFIAAPVTMFTLLCVFGSVMAAMVPVIVGATCAVMMLGCLHYLAFHLSLSIFTINIALLLGLCLSLDYALFIISRFKEELKSQDSIQKVIARTMASAGKAVFFSGLAVFASLSVLLLFPINILFSVGIGGLAAVSLAVLGALTLLPALLSVIKQGINFITLIKEKPSKLGLWYRLAQYVTGRPYRFLLMGMGILLVCASPIRHLKLGIYDYHLLPPHSEGRVFFDKFIKSYHEQALSPILVVVRTHSKILDEQKIRACYHLIHKIQGFKAVDSVSGYLSWIPQGHVQEYIHMYAMAPDSLPLNVQQILKTTTGKHMAVFYVLSKHSSQSASTLNLIKRIRALSEHGLDIQVTGSSATNLDVFSGVNQYIHLAVSLILLMTFIVLLILLKSLFLPIKAIILNILSLTATYGSLVYIFQLGHGQDWLNFDSQGTLDISMLVIIFCALFGFSMDYEVFLLTRIHEDYQKTLDNRHSVVFGIERSAKIITSAAMLVIVLCASFLVAKVIMVKAFGLGIAIAIFLDAFVIRIFLVPAIMTITEKINWLYPKCLKKGQR